jgi:hypothetical protein
MQNELNELRNQVRTLKRSLLGVIELGVVGGLLAAGLGCICGCDQEDPYDQYLDSSAESFDEATNEPISAEFHEPSATEQLFALVSNSDTTSEQVEAVIAAGAEVNARDQMGKSPLLRAVHSDTAGIVAVLLEAGADPNGRQVKRPGDEDGKTPLYEAILADYDGTAVLYVLMLVNAGAEIEATCGGRTALMAATRFRGDPGVVTILLEFGADANRIDDDGKTALDHALENSKFESSDSGRSAIAILEKATAPAASKYVPTHTANEICNMWDENSRRAKRELENLGKFKLKGKFNKFMKMHVELAPLSSVLIVGDNEYVDWIFVTEDGCAADWLDSLSVGRDTSVNVVFAGVNIYEKPYFRCVADD